MALGVGLIGRRAAGFGGPMIVDINRLVDSAVLGSALSGEPTADLAVAVSDQVSTLVIEPGYPEIPAGQFTRANVAAKEFSRARLATAVDSGASPRTPRAHSPKLLTPVT